MSSSTPLIDMTGDTVAGCLVLERVKCEFEANAYWRVRATCGHEFVVNGGRLRSHARRGEVFACQECACRRIVEARR